MKVLPFKIPKPDQDAFIFQIDDDEAFYDKLHQHEEIQVAARTRGDSQRIGPRESHGDGIPELVSERHIGVVSPARGGKAE